ncbi:YicC/YloC family endoribonuclease [Bermanella sp. WJH001]|uniref:YicC/YloC family endoribonuclease n=1 Tax=Bermanella sp. WJH001 TaxID=3048005 RepID=UPI0024BE1034|nr:YicC/YloC family endoribonuclease [Bermanella sp. WJH001]MDJ1538772.1 YicC/YloC family endoribonuclease [Bermanella sp. WJH001]
MHSMTAFARTDLQTDTGSFTWEIRSVNSRYLELHFRLPETLRAVESQVREVLRKSLNRGKVECSLKFTHQVLSQGMNVNETLVSQLNAAADHVHSIIGPGNALDALEILKWPGVLMQPALDSQAIEQDALQAFEVTLTQLIEMREREGAALAQFISQRIDGIAEQVAKVKALLPQILQAQREALLNKLADLKQQVDPDRFEQEMVIVLQKADVDEELDRLDAHLDEVARILKHKGAVGRRLDFMMQELNREANTLSSKSISHLTTQIAVELKVLIEQMREQVQNIE